VPAKLILPPTALAVSLEEARVNLRLDDHDDQHELDPLITAWIMGITDHAEHYMGRAIMQQSWRVVLPSFPNKIELPYPPVSSVNAITYLDTDHIQQTLQSDQYVLDNVTEPCCIIPAVGVTWPHTSAQHHAVHIDITCGYGTNAAATPQAIRLYLLAKLVEQFDPAIKPDKDTVQSSYIDRLLDRYRVMEVA
jgi:uncharacterized phiE125 gp8 family phage protein